MNQILNLNNNDDEQVDKKDTYKKKSFFFKTQFIISIIICLICISSYSYMLYRLNEKERLSQSLIDNFNISRLYSNTTNYSVNLLENNTYTEDSNSFTVIGLIEINKININYPILSEVNDELLKIAPCKFYGPNPNEIGNVCIAAHNYNSYKFFSNIKDLTNGDTIKIYDLKGNIIEYSVYEKREVFQGDLSITSQETNGLREITLVTCNNISGRRLIVKARETQ